MENIITSALLIAFIVVGFVLADRMWKKDRRRGATKNPPPVFEPVECQACARGNLVDEKGWCGFCEDWTSEDIEPSIKWDKPFPNVIYGKFGKVSEVDCNKYSLSMKIPLRGFVSLVWSWVVGRRYIHLACYYTPEGEPLDAAMNMAACGLEDERSHA
jgi:hypothetical protein